MVNYGNGKLYKIVRLSDDVVVYVGSTAKQYLCSRLVEHKSMSKHRPNIRVYKSICENGGWSNHAIILIEHCDCNSKDELHKKEREFVVFLKPIGNFQIPARTKKEWTLDNKEKLNQIINCSCGRTYTHINRARHNKSKIHLNNTPKPDLNIV